MNELLLNYVGCINSKTYRVEVTKTRAPKKALSSEPWFYITKTSFDNFDGQLSIGLPLSEVLKLAELLAMGHL